MAFLETHIFCSPEEYGQDRRLKVCQSELQQGSVYSLPVLLNGNVAERLWSGVSERAARLAARFLLVESNMVAFTILDKDLQPEFDVETPINDGYMNNVRGLFVGREGADEKYRSVRQAFFTEYDDGEWGHLLKASVGFELTSAK